MKKKSLVMLDGNEAAAYVAYAFSEVAAIYPITPSSPMATKTDEWASVSKKNIFGQTVHLVEMQSEAGAVAAVHGALETGVLATSFTSSQGLLLMIPVMHRISGERLPCVLHVASRTIGTHAFSIFGDHSDVMNCRQTGFAMLSSGSVQEVMDLSAIAHLSAIKGRIPMMHFFDGFRTSHELNKIEVIDYKSLAELLDYNALKAFRKQALNPEHPYIRGTVQNGDIYFQVREANNRFYDNFPDIVEEYMLKIYELTGREYHLFSYYGSKEAERIIIAMGSVSGTIKETVDYLNNMGENVGFVQVHLYRPFSIKHLLKVIPSTVKYVGVLDRTKEMGASGEPLYKDVCTAFMGKREITVIGGRYGLSSKDTDPAQIKAVFDNLKKKNYTEDFTIGILDDVTHRSLEVEPCIINNNINNISCKFWGLGSDGTVGANKNTVRIINTYTSKYAQAYFEFDAKKSYGVTISHLRFSDTPITSSYLIKKADFIACHNQTYIEKYDILSELKDGGTLLLNCSWGLNDLKEHIPYKGIQQIIEKKINVYIIDAVKIANQLSLGTHYNMVLQSAFFSLVAIIPIEEAITYMKEAVIKTYSVKGDEMVEKNIAAIEEGSKQLVKVEVDSSWLIINNKNKIVEHKDSIKNNIYNTMIEMKGDDLPVSAFIGYEDGRMNVGLSQLEKRNIAINIPIWEPDKCIQCNICSYVCPHSVIRPFLLNQEELERAPKQLEFSKAKGIEAEGLYYTLQISKMDCTGCGSCTNCCPAKEKAITMLPTESKPDSLESWKYALNLSEKGDLFDLYTVKGSQFRQPLLEFSAACAGCGETPYAKLLTQLLGDRVFWANATGCSQAWGAAMPSIPYTVNTKGQGPAWSNSLFENNAEFSLGMLISVHQQREAEKMRIFKLREYCDDIQINEAITQWLNTYDDGSASKDASEKLCMVLDEKLVNLNGETKEIAQTILEYKDQLSKKTFWMVGGDGWAYDIGFGGLDHVIASGEDINVFIFDNELYANTGGQSSKATPIGAVAQFCSSGKKVCKKDLGALFMAYGNVYVAQVAMGADKNQLLKAIREAENYKGPSVIIAYAPCISHGLKCGMSGVQEEMKRAVESGFWNLYRYNPENENPFTLDSKEAVLPFMDFICGEDRFTTLIKNHPNNAEDLFHKGEIIAKNKYNNYKYSESITNTKR